MPKETKTKRVTKPRGEKKKKGAWISFPRCH